VPDLQRLILRHPSGTTPIVVGRGALAETMADLAAWVAERTLFVVSTPRVLELHGEAIGGLDSTAHRTVVLEVEEGEAAKTLQRAGKLWQQMLQDGGKRDSRLLTFGGGSVGDLGGFVAGCFLRGIDYVQLPTTVLAQVDASVGGKTAVDLPAAKNSVGLFHHPAMVVSEIDFLSTLPAPELRSGLVEIIKMALLLDPLLFEQTEADVGALLAGDPAALVRAVAAGAAAKIRVVEADPEEGGQRGLLNFGHTLGHALESVLSYRGLRHGEAVAYGMLFALRLAERRGLEPSLSQRVRRLLERLDLPPLPEVAVEELVEAMGRDKKVRESGRIWVLPAGLGEGRMVRDVASEEVSGDLEAFLSAPFSPT
jgi:3-dehydroquinate synthase